MKGGKEYPKPIAILRKNILLYVIKIVKIIFIMIIYK
jgi:hypothetical protein